MLPPLPPRYIAHRHWQRGEEAPLTLVCQLWSVSTQETMAIACSARNASSDIRAHQLRAQRGLGSILTLPGLLCGPWPCPFLFLCLALFSHDSSSLEVSWSILLTHAPHGGPRLRTQSCTWSLFSTEDGRQVGTQSDFPLPPTSAAAPLTLQPVCGQLVNSEASFFVQTSKREEKKAVLQAAKLLDKHHTGIGFLQRRNQIHRLTAPQGQEGCSVCPGSRH